MTSPASPAPGSPAIPADASLAAVLLAVDPAGLGGAVVRGPAGPPRDRWLATLAALLPEGAPVRRVPPGTAPDRLLGGLDLAATLALGRPVGERGVLAGADGGVLVLPMAERLEPAAAALVAAALDAGECLVERDGLSFRAPARFAAVALDEGEGEDAAPPAALAERLAFVLAPVRDDGLPMPTRAEVAEARRRLPGVRAATEDVEALCAAAVLWGVASLRAPLFALRAARVLAALEGEGAVRPAHLAAAAALILAPRATHLPPPPSPADTEPPPPVESEAGEAEREPRPGEGGALGDRVVEAVRAALPAGLLASPAEGATPGRRAAAASWTGGGGRRTGTRRGEARDARRLDVLATVRAAAPWQRLRGRGEGEADGRLRVRADDFRVAVRRRRAGTTTVFAVDASGSSALHRLAEAKGAVELLLAEGYVRRDRVALVAFRGRAAELVLPPTRSLARARRTLAGLAGGGATPLAAALDLALVVAQGERRGGGAATLVLLTDGRANVDRAGGTGRATAEEDALRAARAVRAAALPALVIDISPRASPFAARLAEAMGARHLALPVASAPRVREAVRAMAPVAAAR